MSKIDQLNCLSGVLSSESFAVFCTAFEYSEKMLEDACPIVAESIKKSKLDSSNICITASGSIARREAMRASDIDLLPIWCGPDADFHHFVDLTGKIREDLRQELDADVSTSRNLMRATNLKSLCNPTDIGGNSDDRRTLTQRMLILSETEQIGGNKDLKDIRTQVLDAYIADGYDDRPVGKHPMAVCNDVARYFRTLCMDYKSHTENRPEAWAVRHAKLRNARKIWYFSTIMAMSKAVIETEEDDNYDNTFNMFVELLSKPPILRLEMICSDKTQKDVASILSDFAQYLEDMSDKSYREKISLVKFDDRNNEFFSNGDENPYFGMNCRAKNMSPRMLSILENVDNNLRNKVLEWFLI